MDIAVELTMRNKKLCKQASEVGRKDVETSQEEGDLRNVDQVQEYAIREISRIRRTAIRSLERRFGNLLIQSIVEEIHCAARPVFDEVGDLTDHAKCAVWEAFDVVRQDGVFDSLLDDCFTPDVYHQILADSEGRCDEVKSFRESVRERHANQPSVVTLRFAVDDNPEVASVVLDLNTLTPLQCGWLGDRLLGQDVCALWHGGDGTRKLRGPNREPILIIAEAPTAEALLEAIADDEVIIEQRRHDERDAALAVARQMGLRR